MGDVIDLDNDARLQYCDYFENGDQIGIDLADGTATISVLNERDIMITVGKSSELVDREVLSEFLHAAAVLLDYDYKYMASGAYQTIEYPEP